MRRLTIYCFFSYTLANMEADNNPCDFDTQIQELLMDYYKAHTNHGDAYRHTYDLDLF